jgi:hypothetical protein
MPVQAANELLMAGKALFESARSLVKQPAGEAKGRLPPKRLGWAVTGGIRFRSEAEKSLKTQASWERLGTSDMTSRGFLNLGSEVQVLFGTPFSTQFPVYGRERE